MAAEDTPGGREAVANHDCPNASDGSFSQGDSVDDSELQQRQRGGRDSNGRPPALKRARSYSEYDSSLESSEAKGDDVKTRVTKLVSSVCCKRPLLQVALSYFPVVEAMRGYDVKKCLPGDVISGLSVAVLQVAQGLGYAVVAGLPPAYGVHVAFFHALVYFVFGTSRHLSVGTNALVSLMVASLLSKELTAIRPSGCVNGSHSAFPTNVSSFDDGSGGGGGEAAPSCISDAELQRLALDIAASASFLVGALLCALSFLRVGTLFAFYVSPAFVTSFTCATVLLVVSSQARYALFGSGSHYVGSYWGPLKVFYTWRDVFASIAQTNWLCVVCFVVSMTILLAVKIGINKNPRLRRRLVVPVPIDLVVIVLFTGLSYGLSFESLPPGVGGVAVVGPMMTGLPSPSVPTFYRWTEYIGDVVLISVLVHLSNFTIARYFNDKYEQRDVDYDKEMLASGLCHLVASFFSGFPGSTNPPRCFLQDAAGSKSRLSSLVSCVVLVLVIYFLSPSLRYLPLSVVAAIVWVSVKRAVGQLASLKAYWQRDKLDFAAWLVTFVSTVVLDVQLGMIVGIAFHVFTVPVRMQLSRVYAPTGDTDLVCFDGDAPEMQPPANGKSPAQPVAVLRYDGPILFVNSSRFTSLARSAAQKSSLGAKDGLQAIAIDCTHVSFVDTAAVAALAKLKAVLAEQGVALYLCSCSPLVRSTLSRCDSALYKSAFLTVADVELEVEAQRTRLVSEDQSNVEIAGERRHAEDRVDHTENAS